MIDERFSKKTFTTLGVEAARSRADELQREVLDAIHEDIGRSVREIVSKLNEMGHDLVVEIDAPGDLSFRDDATGVSALRLGIDVVVSAGYADTSTSDGIRGERGEE